MARPKKATVDYFPHKCNHGKTLFILENKFGNDGYAFWFKLLEILGSTEGHFYDFNPAPEKQFLLAKTRVSEITAADILKTLSDVNAIDAELWDVGLIWSDNFIDNISDAYSKRIDTLPTKEGLRLLKPHLFSVNGVSDNGSTESKVKERKVKKKKVKEKEIPFPEDFEISEEVKKWSDKNNFNPDDYFESFQLWAASKYRTYISWDSVFKRFIKEDWGKVRMNNNGNKPKEPQLSCHEKEL